MPCFGHNAWHSLKKKKLGHFRGYLLLTGADLSKFPYRILSKYKAWNVLKMAASNQNTQLPLEVWVSLRIFLWLLL